jgi:hypothetical protein
MASEGGSDPSEDAAKLFAVTESLVGAGIAPAIHLGRGIIISELSRSTVAATIETGEDEEPYVFEIVKGKLGVVDRGVSAARRSAAAEVVDLDDLEGEYDEEEDGDGVASVDVSVKSEQLEDEDSESLLNDLHAAAGGSGAVLSVYSQTYRNWRASPRTKRPTVDATSSLSAMMRSRSSGPQMPLTMYTTPVVWLVHVRRVQVETARKYFGEALSAHVTYYGPPVPGYNMPRVRKMIKGMAKVIDASPRRPRRVRPNLTV